MPKFFFFLLLNIIQSNKCNSFPEFYFVFLSYFNSGKLVDCTVLYDRAVTHVESLLSVTMATHKIHHH